MRYPFQGTTKDGNGRIIQSATVTVYLAGVATLASVYAAATGGAAVNSVTADTAGNFTFWVDDINYHYTQRFDVVISSPNHITKTYSSIEIPGRSPFIDAERYSTFTAAVAAAANKTLRFSSSITLDANITIPATVSLEPINPGILVANGKTLTINAPVVGNPMHQWLSGFAAGDVTFGAGNINHCTTVWWGFAESASAAINAAALQGALDSGLNVLMPPGDYNYSTGLVIDTAVSLSGTFDTSVLSRPKTKLTYTGTGIAISVALLGSNSELSKFTLIGTSSAVGGIFVGSDGYCNTNKLYKIYIDSFSGVGAYGLRVSGHYNIIELIEASNNYYGLYTFTNDACNVNSFINCKFRSSLKYGAYIMDAVDSSFYDCSFEGNRYEGTYIYSDKVKQLNFYSCYWESNMGVGGAASVTLSGASASDRPTFINFYSPNGEETPMFYLDKAQYCTIMNPRVTPGGRIKIEANAVSIKVIGSNLLTFVSGTYNHANGVYWEDTANGAGILTANSTTPNVSEYNHVYYTANTQSTTYTDFLYGRTCQTITIIFRDANSIVDFTNDATPTNLVGNGGANWTPSVNDHMVCTYLAESGKWYCKISDNTL